MAPLVLAAALLGGCPPPDYDPVELQVDLQVDPAADPFDELGSVRVCLARDGGSTFGLYPRDPGEYLFRGVAEGDVLTIDVIGFDLPPDDIRAGAVPQVLAAARVEAATVGTEAEPGYAAVVFQRCGDDCPEDCAVPLVWEDGSAAIGLRRTELP